MRALAAAAAAVLFTFCTSTSPRETPEEVVQRFVGAFNRLSVEEMRPLFAVDATAFLPLPQHAGRIDGRDAILAILAPLFDADRERRKGEPLRMEAKELAVTRTRDVAVATFDVGTAEVRSRRTVVMERRGERWAIVHLHASNVR
ncbi:MAG TPA: nuclear transport factor 2 family protein [Thermoanaerobaculia bacterium]|nr:nuclear transport factor 2 family protein [Thermoanaerobaculia bacterium]